MDVVLIRHARPCVDEGVCYGRLDLPLCEPLSPSVERMIESLRVGGAAAPDRIVASPALRARQTAQHLAAACGAGKVELDARLREVDFGDWEGLRWDAVPREGLDQWAADLLGACPHGGETTGTALARVVEWANEVVVRQHGGASLWAVCHAGPMRMLAAHWLGVPLTVTLDWQLGWGSSCAFRLPSSSATVARLLWWNRAPLGDSETSH